MSATATDDDIKAAYRLKAKAYHPDRLDPFLRAHAEEMFKMINDAYDSLVARRRRR